MMDRIEQLSTRQLFYSRTVSLFFITKFLTALVTSQESPAGAQFPCFPDETSKVESLLTCFESHEEALLDWVLQRLDSSVRWHKYASSYDALVRRLFEASGRINSELCRRRLFGCYESNWVWSRMECAGHVMSHAPYIGICECATSSKLRRLSGSSLSEIGPLASQVMSSIDVASDVTGISGVNSVGEDNSMMFKTYRGPLPIQLHWYELPLDTCRSGNLGVAPIRGEEHDARDTIRLYKDAIRKDAMELGDSLVRAPTQQELKINERVIAYNAGEMDKVVRIDEREQEHRK